MIGLHQGLQVEHIQQGAICGGCSGYTYTVFNKNLFYKNGIHTPFFNKNLFYKNGIHTPFFNKNLFYKNGVNVLKKTAKIIYMA